MSNKFTAIYARQSVDKKDSLSVAGQIELCKKECLGECRVYEDRGFSGKNTNRPAFERLMSDIEAGRVNRLICYRLDRISRSIMDFGSIWNMLSKYEVEFVSVNEKFDTSTPAGRAMLYIIMVFAQLERETIAERIKDNYYQRVKKGAWPGGPAPYGFRIAPKKKNGVCTLEPTDEMAIVKLIYEMYSQPGMSLGKVAKRLSDEGIPCTQRKTWDNISVFRVLRNPAFAKADIDVYAYYKAKGLIIFNEPSEFTGENGAIIIGKRLSNERKYTDMNSHLFALSTHEGIIPSAQFLACQYKLDANKQIKNTGTGKHTWLSGLLSCKECGYSLKVQQDHGSGRLRLICSGRTNYHACGMRHTESVESAELFAREAIEERIRQMRSKKESGSTSDANPDLNAMKLSLVKIEERIANLLNALSEANDVSMRYINAELLRLDEEKITITRKLTETAISPVIDTPYAVDFDILSFNDKKLVANLFIRKITCSQDGFEAAWK